MSEYWKGYIVCLIGSIIGVTIGVMVISNIHNKELINESKIAHQRGKQSQISENNKRGVMTEQGKWTDGLEVAK